VEKNAATTIEKLPKSEFAHFYNPKSTIGIEPTTFRSRMQNLVKISKELQT